jgi:predicted HAD superfamily Cof-like phosphohydrolase
MNTPTRPLHDIVRATRQFNLAAGRTEDVFDPRAIALHLGLQLEEMAETLAAVCNHPNVREMDRLSLWRVANLIKDMDAVATEFKNGLFDGSVLNADRQELLDGCIDVIVVSIGNIMSQGANMLAAMDHVAGKNLEKIGPDGVCIKNAAGKIQKPAGWTPPVLEPFVKQMTTDEAARIRNGAR